jgi:hypothetical protein
MPGLQRLALMLDGLGNHVRLPALQGLAGLTELFISARAGAKGLDTFALPAQILPACQGRAGNVMDACAALRAAHIADTSAGDREAAGLPEQALALRHWRACMSMTTASLCCLRG